jgi:hypothetical protein
MIGLLTLGGIGLAVDGELGFETFFGIILILVQSVLVLVYVHDVIDVPEPKKVMRKRARK